MQLQQAKFWDAQFIQLKQQFIEVIESRRLNSCVCVCTCELLEKVWHVANLYYEIIFTKIGRAFFHHFSLVPFVNLY